VKQVIGGTQLLLLLRWKDRKKYLLKAIKLGNVDARLMLKKEYGEKERVTEL